MDNFASRKYSPLIQKIFLARIIDPSLERMAASLIFSSPKDIWRDDRQKSREHVAVPSERDEIAALVMAIGGACAFLQRWLKPFPCSLATSRCRSSRSKPKGPRHRGANRLNELAELVRSIGYLPADLRTHARTRVLHRRTHVCVQPWRHQSSLQQIVQ